MNNTVILTKTSQKGQRIEVLADRRTGGIACATVRVDGMIIERRQDMVKASGLPSGATHRIGRVCLMPEDSAIVSAALAQLQGELDIDSKVVACRLRSERQAMVLEISDLEDAAQYHSDRAWAREDESGAFMGKGVVSNRKAAQVVRERLAAFDREHPEVLSELRRENAEKAARYAEIN